MGLGVELAENLCVPNTGGRFLLPGKDCPLQTVHNDSGHKDIGCSNNFIILTGRQ